MQKLRFGTLLFIAALTLLASGCRKADAPAPVRTDTTSESGPASEPGPTSAVDPDTGGNAVEAEAPSRLNGLEVAAPRPFENPDEAQLGTLPEGIGLAKGSTVPMFAALDMNQDPPVEVTRDDLLDDGPILMVFYRGGW